MRRPGVRSGPGSAAGAGPARAGKVAASAALVGLPLLTFAVRQGLTDGLDRSILAAFAALRGPVPDSFFQAVTWLGSSYVLVPAAILAMAALAAHRQWAAARLLGYTYFGASLTTWLLKPAIGRERPQLHAWIESLPADLAFPSGHATHSAAFALGLWLVAVRKRPHWRIPAGLMLGALVFLVAASRLYLQVHWPSDILGGLLVAAVWAGLALAAGRHGGATGRGA